MKKTFKPPINWIMKKEYQKNLDSLMKQFFCNIKGIKKDGGFAAAKNLGIAEGKLCGTNEKRVELLDSIKSHYRTEGIWLAMNDIIEEDKEKKEDKQRGSYLG